MKRFVNLIILAMACFTVCLASSGKCGNNITWNLDRNGILTLEGNGMMPDFSETPWHPDLVRSVVISEGITSIGKNAFKKCKNLTSVYISNTVKLIGDNAFYNCKHLFDIIIPSSVEHINSKAFAGCEKLISIVIPYGVKTIENEAFSGCEGLSSIRIASSVKRIGVDAFKGCVNLVDFKELPNCVTKQNSEFLGLNKNAVSDYWANVQTNTNPVMQENETITQYNEQYTAPEQIVNVQSDVDVYIPQNPTNNENTFVVIIANENYNKLADVRFARNDGKVFGEYCHKTLGIPTTNIRRYEDATFGVMLEALADIKNISKAYRGDLKVIFYYCGHGAPDELSGEAYLLPTDAFAVSPKTCLAISALYEELGLMKAISTTVFLDACFSGATRDDSMLMSARGVAIAPKSDMPTGNVAVLSASTGAETALQYADQGHGLFTYYLLKKLQETKGNVSLGELSEYVTRKVEQKSTVVNRKSQTPTMSVSPLVINKWQNWQLKD